MIFIHAESAYLTDDFSHTKGVETFKANLRITRADFDKLSGWVTVNADEKNNVIYYTKHLSSQIDVYTTEAPVDTDKNQTS